MTQVIPDVLEDHSVITFTVKQSTRTITPWKWSPYDPPHHLPEDLNLQVNAKFLFITYTHHKEGKTGVLGRLPAVYNMITGWQSVNSLKAPTMGSTLEGRNPAEVVLCHLNPV
jgi:hypothetical protein